MLILPCGSHHHTGFCKGTSLAGRYPIANLCGRSFHMANCVSGKRWRTILLRLNPFRAKHLRRFRFQGPPFRRRSLGRERLSSIRLMGSPQVCALSTSLWPSSEADRLALVYLERLLIYHAPRSKIWFVGMGRVTTIVTCGFGLAVAGPAFYAAPDVPWYTAPISTWPKVRLVLVSKLTWV